MADGGCCVRPPAGMRCTVRAVGCAGWQLYCARRAQMATVTVALGLAGAWARGRGLSNRQSRPICARQGWGSGPPALPVVCHSIRLAPECKRSRCPMGFPLHTLVRQDVPARCAAVAGAWRHSRCAPVSMDAGAAASRYFARSHPLRSSAPLRAATPRKLSQRPRRPVLTMFNMEWLTCKSSTQPPLHVRIVLRSNQSQLCGSDLTPRSSASGRRWSFPATAVALRPSTLCRKFNIRNHRYD